MIFSLSVAFATSYAPPVARDVWSPGRGAMVHTDPLSSTWSVYAAHDLQSPLWTFQRPVGYEEFSVSDDGKTVVIAHWRHVQADELDEPALEWWTSAGTQTRSVRSLVAHPSHPRGIGPIGPTWRSWVDDVSFGSDGLEVTTTGWWQYRLGWDGSSRGRSLAPLGASMHFLGAAAWAALFGLIGLAEAERRAGTGLGRIAAVLLAGGASAAWLGTYLAGGPVPAELLMWLDWPLWLLGLLSSLPALIAALRTRWRRLWLLLLALLWLEVIVMPLTSLFVLPFVGSW